jgi:integrase/recombinase XerD
MLSHAVQSYLAVRRACGFDLVRIGENLESFATFSDAAGKSHVSTPIAITWAGLSNSVPMRARRLGDVIRFARYVHAEDFLHEVPPPVFGSENRRRSTPYILSRSEIDGLVKAAFRPLDQGLGRDTYSVLFALLACTGLRVSEVIRLCYDDLTPDGLVIRRSKFRKSRLVPLHATARAALANYLDRRRLLGPTDPHLFVSTRGKPLRVRNVRAAFRNSANKIGLPRHPAQPRATPHSLRHTFAVRALESCPDGRDHITQHMLSLSTYLGHSNVAHTYWYLEATPALMRSIAQSSEHFHSGDRP